MPDIIDTKLNRVREKRYTFKDYILPGGGILLGLASIIFAFLTNIENNENATKLKQFEVNSNQKVKEYEITYLEKRKSYALLLNLIDTYAEDYVNQSMEAKYENSYDEMKRKYLEIRSHCYLMHPFLNRVDRDSLDMNTFTFYISTLQHMSNRNQINDNQDWNNYNMSFTNGIYFDYRSYIKNNLFIKLFPNDK